ncbi:MAG TPA: hypothetical protein VFI91_12515 [Longimicrobiaceae bacterium]|nr:hypothetical protein [Longimicrobiaceae bacterium]
MIRVGPAGWLYKNWKGVVYPEPVPKGLGVDVLVESSYFGAYLLQFPWSS